MNRLGSAAVRAGRSFANRNLSTAGFLDNPRTVSIVGCPLTWGQPHLGADKGPSVLREAGLISRIMEEEWMILDKGDLDFDGFPVNKPDYPGANRSNAVGHATRLISDSVAEEASQGRFVLSLGGDHAMAIGTGAGILKARPDSGVIWVVRTLFLYCFSSLFFVFCFSFPLGLGCLCGLWLRLVIFGSAH